METDAVFDAEAEVGPELVLIASNSRDPALESQRKVSSAAESGAQVPPNHSGPGGDEHTPLLGRNSRSPAERTRAAAVDGEDNNDDEGHDDDERWAGAADFEGLPWWNTPSVYWLLPPFSLFTLAFGGVIVPKINLILTLICRQYLADRAIKDPSFQFLPVVFDGGDNPQCQIPEVQALVSKFTLYCNLIPGILTAISSPKLGELSDRYGRKRVIALTTLGMLLSEVITIIAATYPESVSVNWLLFGYALDGLAGSFIAGMALTHSYATDCTPPARRNVAFGLFHGCLFSGIALGPIIAGYLIKATDNIVSVFYLALVAHFLFMFCVLFVIPESLTPQRQAAAREKHRLKLLAYKPPAYLHFLKGTPLYPLLTFLIPTATQFFTPLNTLFPRGPGTNSALRANLVLLASIDTIMFGVAMGSMTVVILYSEITFGWGNLESSIFVSAVNTGRVLMLVIVLPIATRLFRNYRGSPVATTKKQRNLGSDRLDLTLIRLAVFFDMAGYLGYVLVRTGPLFTASGILASFGGIGSPTIQSALTKHVPSDRTGQLLGASGLLHALARVVAPTVINLIYAKTVGTFRQTVFVCLTAMFAAAFLLSWGLRPYVSVDEQEDTLAQQRLLRSEEIGEEECVAHL